MVLGSYMDRRGRRAGLILTLTLMAIGTVSLAVTPSYAAIGILAPIIITAGRLIQGFSLGVEAVCSLLLRPFGLPQRDRCGLLADGARRPPMRFDTTEPCAIGDTIVIKERFF